MTNLCNELNIKKCHKQDKVCNPISGRCISTEGKTYKNLPPDIKFKIVTNADSSEERKYHKKSSSKKDDENKKILTLSNFPDDVMQNIYSILTPREIAKLDEATPKIQKLNVLLYLNTHRDISLEKAIKEGNVNIVKYYIESEEKIPSKALDMACKYGHTKIVKLLLQNDSVCSEKNKKHKENNYGLIAQKNGNIFEEKIVEWCNKEENKIKVLKKLGYNNVENKYCAGYFKKCPSDKVKSIHSKKTTRKSDIWYIEEDKKIKIGISIKMSNIGTQLQIISLEIFESYLKKNNIKLGNKTKKILKKFLGLIEPTYDEQLILNKNRNNLLQNKKRWWINELHLEEKDKILQFLKSHYDLLLKLILTDGLCVNSEDKASLFILNNADYTKTKKIEPIILTFKELISKFKGSPKITINGSLELNDLVGIQRKGSGSGSSSNCLQFKDRGYKKFL